MLSPSPAAGRGLGSYPPPPAYLKLPQGEISHAVQTTNPFAGQRSRRSGAQKAGLAYQKRVGALLAETVGSSNMVSGPWYYYLDGSGRRNYCQPDFLLCHAFEAVVVTEVKLRWTADAWWQLRKIYLPVLCVARPQSKLLALCICRSYDPAIRIEEPVHFVDSPSEAVADKFNLCVMRL